MRERKRERERKKASVTREYLNEGEKKGQIH